MTRQAIALLLCSSLAGWAQEISIDPVKPARPSIVRPYFAPDIPAVRVNNSPRLAELVKGGKLYLTVQDAVALALENNIDVEVSRYNAISGGWRVTRSEAGGALPGVPSSASQAGSVASGQGVAGSQAAAGVSTGGGAARSGSSSNSTIAQIGPVTQNLDAVVQETSTFTHKSQPQSNTTQSGIPNLISANRAHTLSVQQGLLSGGLVTMTFSDRYLRENALSDLLNPSVAPSLSISIQHNLLRGFGKAVNARTITVSRLNLNITDLNFKNQAIGLVAQVLNLYYNLAVSDDDLRTKRVTESVADTFLHDVRQQIELGSVAPPEAITAEQQFVTARQAVKDAEATHAQQEIRLKNLISRSGTADPLLKNAPIVTVDKIVIPEKDDLPPVDAMIKEALDNRPDLAAAKAGEETAAITAIGTRNGVLPTVVGFASESHAGLAGDAHTVVSGSYRQAPDPYFVGGIGNALGQIFRRNFPTEQAGVFYQLTVRNNQARADQAIDAIQLRQTQLQNQKSRNQVAVDIMNDVVAIGQARARYDAAVKNRQLQEELYQAEQKRYELGASTPYNVIRQQKDFTTAQSTEMSARVAYSNARIALDQVMGSTLETAGIKIAEVQAGRIGR